MSPTERRIHKALISLVFSLINWMIIDYTLVDLPFWKYFIIELFLVVSMKFYIFTTRKMNL